MQCLAQINALNLVADIPAVEHVGYVRQADDGELAFIGAKAMLDAGPHVFEIEGILVVRPMSVPHGMRTGLANTLPVSKVPDVGLTAFIDPSDLSEAEFPQPFNQGLL